MKKEIWITMGLIAAVTLVTMTINTVAYLGDFPEVRDMAEELPTAFWGGYAISIVSMAVAIAIYGWRLGQGGRWARVIWTADTLLSMVMTGLTGFNPVGIALCIVKGRLTWRLWTTHDSNFARKGEVMVMAPA